MTASPAWTVYTVQLFGGIQHRDEMVEVVTLVEANAEVDRLRRLLAEPARRMDNGGAYCPGEDEEPMGSPTLEN